jgi:hypothetical protein
MNDLNVLNGGFRPNQLPAQGYRTFRPQGAGQVPTSVPPLPSGVAPANSNPAPPNPAPKNRPQNGG